MPPAFPDHFSGHADEYAQHRPRYPAELFAWLAERAPGRRLAWDVATGNGQAAVALRAHFGNVYATDASAAQLEHAPDLPGVRFAVERAEKATLPDASVDLVTVAQGLHWFELARFFPAVRRVLRPGGLFAAWCYELCTVDPDVDAVVLAFYNGPIGPFWPPQRRHIENGYADLEIPLDPVPDAPAFDMRARWIRAEFLGYLGTWSAVRRYRA